MGYNPWGRKESDTTERLTHTHKALTFQKSYVLCKYSTLMFVPLKQVKDFKKKKNWLIFNATNFTEADGI